MRAADDPVLPRAELPDSGQALRIGVVDALRGFALLGILVVNIGYFASAFHANGITNPAFMSWLDLGAEWLVLVAFQAKFYLIFSFLFGYSFTLQLESAVRAGAAFTPSFLRRLGGLFVLGVAHAILLFPGDILMLYAVLGLVLLAVRRLRQRPALIAAAVLVVVSAAGWVVRAVTWSGGFDHETVLAEVQRASAAYLGSPASVIGQHVAELPDYLLTVVALQGPIALAAFLVGMVAGKARVLAEPAAYASLLRRLMVVGYPVGLAGAVLYGHARMFDYGTTYQLYALAVDTLTAPLLSAAYVATALRVFQRGRLGSFLAPAGRIALSNYLAQSLLCVLIFTGAGLGLMNQVAPAVELVVVVVIFVALALASAWWLRRHQYGPAEWLLRAVTTLRVPGRK